MVPASTAPSTQGIPRQRAKFNICRQGQAETQNRFVHTLGSEKERVDDYVIPVSGS